MKKYLLKRFLLSIFSLVMVTILIMILIFMLKDRETIFANDVMLSRLNENQREVYKSRQLMKFGYIDFIEYSDYVNKKMDEEGIEDEGMRYFYAQFPRKEKDIEEGKIYSYWYTDEVTGEDRKIEGENPYLMSFRTDMEAQGYKVTFLNYTNAKPTKAYFATRDRPLITRILEFFGGLFYFENTNNVVTNKDIVRGIHWEWDPYSNAPALVGSGTTHKYLMYYDVKDKIFASQNWFHINLGVSFTGATKDKSIESILLADQGAVVVSTTPYPAQFTKIDSAMNNKETVNLSAVVYSSNDYTLSTDEIASASKAYFDSEKNRLNLSVGDVVPEGSYEKTIVDKFEVNSHLVSYYFNDPRQDIEFYESETAATANFNFSPLASNRSLAGEYDIYINQNEIVTTVFPNTSDFHTALYSYGDAYNPEYYVDDYTNLDSAKDGKSMMGYSFLIGILATVLAYILGLPLGIWMARRKDKIVDRIGTGYIIFIIAVPSLAYIAIFRTLGGLVGLPKSFAAVANPQWLVYVLPIISLALPSIAGLMRWTRRYMIDQSNSDYVKFARSQGMSEGEIFVKHIAKNASIPIVHGIPGSILGCIAGAFITERFYLVPGTGKLLTTAINQSDNGIIVGLAFFYAALSIISLILGDLLLTVVDPRISFVEGSKK